MSKRLYPYVIFLPKEKKEKVLKVIFESEVPIEILKYALRQGALKRIYQKDLIANLGRSNKTIISHLKSLVKLQILDAHMEKAERAGRTVWVKYYTLTDLGRWFALLLVEEENLTNEEKMRIVRNALRSYTRWIRELSEKLEMPREELARIFEEEMK
jgi:predicted transcriptional regulator